MSCWRPSEEEERRRHSKAIDDEICREIRSYGFSHRYTISLLLLGTEHSGKSTFLKQLKILYGNEFSLKERQQMVAIIHSNIREIITTVLNTMSTLNPPLQLVNPESVEHSKYLLEEANKPDYYYPPEFFNHCLKLWNDPGMMACYSRSNEYQLMDSAHYFMDPQKFKDISMPTYLPTIQDILQCQEKSQGVSELKFELDGHIVHIIDPGQRSNSLKWLQCFNGVTSIFFFVDCNSYNVCSQNPNKNLLEESVDLFKSVWDSEWLKEASVTMFLNKQDLLKQKIMEGHFKLESYFPEYKTISKDVSSESLEVEEAKEFIRDLFMKTTKRSPGDRRNCYSHFTCAVDT
ncbi:guanine nucleotide-binding protein G(olf) subunit alpha-like isoform X2 [Dysidea avara]|uniref:guanine nucleotide-binding protein G(olf) subunit alpha-like isoform X2 n=1 Tax=Dysidea avara TaxID=196820 RepID=UPI003318C43C